MNGIDGRLPLNEVLADVELPVLGGGVDVADDPDVPADPRDLYLVDGLA